MKKWLVTILPKTVNYLNNNNTNYYFDIRTDSENKILEKKETNVP